jgi:integrase
VLPASRTKSKRKHALILPEPALQILRAQPRNGERPFVFGRKGAGLGGWGYGKNRFDKLVAEAAGRSLPHWTLHDLRRTAATRLSDFAPPHIVDAVIAHAAPRLHRTYNKNQYINEKKAALGTWAETLAAIVEQRGPKVVALSRSA